MRGACWKGVLWVSFIWPIVLGATAMSTPSETSTRQSTTSYTSADLPTSPVSPSNNTNKATELKSSTTRPITAIHGNPADISATVTRATTSDGPTTEGPTRQSTPFSTSTSVQQSSAVSQTNRTLGSSSTQASHITGSTSGTTDNINIVTAPTSSKQSGPSLSETPPQDVSATGELTTYTTAYPADRITTHVTTKLLATATSSDITVGTTADTEQSTASTIPRVTAVVSTSGTSGKQTEFPSTRLSPEATSTVFQTHQTQSTENTGQPDTSKPASPGTDTHLKDTTTSSSSSTNSQLALGSTSSETATPAKDFLPTLSSDVPTTQSTTESPSTVLSFVTCPGTTGDVAIFVTSTTLPSISEVSTTGGQTEQSPPTFTSLSSQEMSAVSQTAQTMGAVITRDAETWTSASQVTDTFSVVTSLPPSPTPRGHTSPQTTVHIWSPSSTSTTILSAPVSNNHTSQTATQTMPAGTTSGPGMVISTTLNDVTSSSPSKIFSTSGEALPTSSDTVVYGNSAGVFSSTGISSDASTKPTQTSTSSVGLQSTPKHQPSTSVETAVSTTNPMTRPNLVSSTTITSRAVGSTLAVSPEPRSHPSLSTTPATLSETGNLQPTTSYTSSHTPPPLGSPSSNTNKETESGSSTTSSVITQGNTEDTSAIITTASVSDGSTTEGPARQSTPISTSTSVQHPTAVSRRGDMQSSASSQGSQTTGSVSPANDNITTATTPNSSFKTRGPSPSETTPQDTLATSELTSFTAAQPTDRNTTHVTKELLTIPTSSDGTLGTSADTAHSTASTVPQVSSVFSTSGGLEGPSAPLSTTISPGTTSASFQTHQTQNMQTTAQPNTSQSATSRTDTTLEDTATFSSSSTNRQTASGNASPETVPPGKVTVFSPAPFTDSHVTRSTNQSLSTVSSLVTTLSDVTSHPPSTNLSTRGDLLATSSSSVTHGDLTAAVRPSAGEPGRHSTNPAQTPTSSVRVSSTPTHGTPTTVGTVASTTNPMTMPNSVNSTNIPSHATGSTLTKSHESASNLSLSTTTVTSSETSTSQPTTSYTSAHMPPSPVFPSSNMSKMTELESGTTGPVTAQENTEDVSATVTSTTTDNPTRQSMPISTSTSVQHPIAVSQKGHTQSSASSQGSQTTGSVSPVNDNITTVTTPNSSFKTRGPSPSEETPQHTSAISELTTLLASQPMDTNTTQITKELPTIPTHSDITLGTSVDTARSVTNTTPQFSSLFFTSGGVVAPSATVSPGTTSASFQNHQTENMKTTAQLNTSQSATSRTDTTLEDTATFSSSSTNRQTASGSASPETVPPGKVTVLSPTPFSDSHITQSTNQSLSTVSSLVTTLSDVTSHPPSTNLSTRGDLLATNSSSVTHGNNTAGVRPSAGEPGRHSTNPAQTPTSPFRMSSTPTHEPPTAIGTVASTTTPTTMPNSVSSTENLPSRATGPTLTVSHKSTSNLLLGTNTATSSETSTPQPTMSYISAHMPPSPVSPSSDMSNMTELESGTTGPVTAQENTEDVSAAVTGATTEGPMRQSTPISTSTSAKQSSAVSQIHHSQGSHSTQESRITGSVSSLTDSINTVSAPTFSFQPTGSSSSEAGPQDTLATSEVPIFTTAHPMDRNTTQVPTELLPTPTSPDITLETSADTVHSTANITPESSSPASASVGPGGSSASPSATTFPPASPAIFQTHQPQSIETTGQPDDSKPASPGTDMTLEGATTSSSTRSSQTASGNGSPEIASSAPDPAVIWNSTTALAGHTSPLPYFSTSPPVTASKGSTVKTPTPGMVTASPRTSSDRRSTSASLPTAIFQTFTTSTLRTSTATHSTALPFPVKPNKGVSLFSYGLSAGDHEFVKRTVDFTSPLFKPEIGFPFGSCLRDSLYFTDNGQIIFPDSNYQISSYANPPSTGFTSWDPVALVAPFWDDADFSSHRGTMFYQEYKTFYGEYHPLVWEVESWIKKYTNDWYYKARWTLKVTWFGVPAYPAHWTVGTNTYQAVLSTDGSKSYALFLYQSGGMQWNPAQRPANSVLIGFSSGDGYFQNSPLTSRPTWEKYLPDQFLDTNSGLRGLQLYRLHREKRPNYRLKCLQWLKRQPQWPSWGRNEISCPCSWQQGRWDFRFQPTNLGWWDLDSRQLCSYSSWQGGVCCSYGPWGEFREGWRVQQPWQLDQELQAQNWCCRWNDKPFFCAQYHQRQPPVSCAGYRPPRPAWMFGDPHISTLDGANYTFNGLGDFLLVRAQDRSSSFLLQGRTAQTRGAQATNFIAFAAQYNSSNLRPITVRWLLEPNNKIQVQLNNNSVTFEANKDDAEGQETFNSTGILLTHNGSMVSANFDGTVTISVIALSDILHASLSLPQEYQNHTEGLLGVWNNNPDDDFKMPNDSTIPRNSSEKMIFHYGMTWKINGTSLLGERSDQLPSNFTPIFYDELSNSSLYQNLTSQCNENPQCIFDALATGNRSTGLHTRALLKGFQGINTTLNHYPPSIKGDQEIKAYKGQTTRVQYTSNLDSVTFSLRTNSTDFTLFENGTLLWTPKLPQPFTLGVLARNVKDGLSSELQPSTVACFCSTEQQCLYNQTSWVGNSSLQVAACKCGEDTFGQYCQRSRDPCEQCFPNVSCISGKHCGACPPYMTGDGRHCAALENSFRCENKSCPENYCYNHGHCYMSQTPQTPDCQPSCTCPPAFIDARCFLAGNDFTPTASAELPVRTIHLFLQEKENASVAEVNTSVAHILRTLDVPAFLRNSLVIKSNSPTSTSGSLLQCWSVISEFQYRPRGPVINFLNHQLLDAVVEAFLLQGLRRRRPRREEPRQDVAFLAISRSNVRSVQMLNLSTLETYFTCSGYKGYHVVYSPQSGFTCVSPCNEGYCEHGGQCQHLPEGPSCSCASFSIYSPWGERCEHLSIKVGAFFGILFGALGALLLVGTAAFVILRFWTASGIQNSYLLDSEN